MLHVSLEEIIHTPHTHTHASKSKNVIESDKTQTVCLPHMYTELPLRLDRPDMVCNASKRIPSRSMIPDKLLSLALFLYSALYSYYANLAINSIISIAQQNSNQSFSFPILLCSR